MRSKILRAVKSLVESTNTCKKVLIKQKDWRTESEFPVAYITMPAQSFEVKSIHGEGIKALRGNALLSIRIVVENTDEVPELQLDEIMDEIIDTVLKNSDLNNTVITTDVLQTQTDGGILITHSIGQIDLEIQF